MHKDLEGEQIPEISYQKGMQGVLLGLSHQNMIHKSGVKPHQ